MFKVNELKLRIKQKEILKGISFSIEEGSFTAVIGKNGSGKSSLISCINQMKRYEGVMSFQGTPIKSLSSRERAKAIAVLPQLLASPHIMVEDLVKMGRNPYLDIGQHLTQTDQVAVAEAMDLMGIADLQNRFLDELSGGERQKAYLAMLIAQDAELLVLDEPTTYMDIEYQTGFLNVLKKLKEKNKKTLLVAMHDLNLVAEYADHVILLDKGELIFAGTKEECMNAQCIEKIFGVKQYNVDGKDFFQHKRV